MKEVIYNFDDIFNVIDYTENGKQLRALASKNVIYSVTNRENDRNDLVLDYLKLYDLPCLNSTIKNALVLGAGCFTYPKYFISRYKNSFMDAVEINNEIIKIAFNYFFLNELYEEFDRNKERLKIYNTDAYNYVENCNKKYDYILLDIFNDNKVDKKFLSEKYISKIMEILNKDSFLGINYILDKENIDLFKSLYSTLKSYFKNVHIYTVKDNSIFYNGSGNIYILSTDNTQNIELEDKYLKLIINDLI